MHYFGTRLSENISRREPEGYLLCLNVPVARTGVQEYLPSELSAPGLTGPVPVYRPPEEVFSPEAMASFEGMPVTEDHPPDGVDAGNIRVLQKGHTHNVRRGAGSESDLLLADLIITDPGLISAILEEGKREISCGYTYELCAENGRYVQRRIRGNHVAVVDAGRAGPRVSIRDGQPPGTEARKEAAVPHHTPTDERSRTIMKKSLSRILARVARDGDIETVAEIIGEMIGPSETEEAPAAAEPPQEPDIPDPEAVVETAGGNVIAVDEEGVSEIIGRLDRIIELLQPAAADGDPAETIPEVIGEAVAAAVQQNADPVAGEIAAVMEEVLDPVLSGLPEPEEEGGENALPETLNTGDALRAALAAVRPVLARLPRAQRRKMAGDIAAGLRKTESLAAADRGVYAALSAAGRRTSSVSADLGRRIMEKRNPGYKKQR